MDDANLVEKLDLKHSCFGKALLLEWRNGKRCCHACFTEYGKIEIFFKKWTLICPFIIQIASSAIGFRLALKGGTLDTYIDKSDLPIIAGSGITRNKSNNLIRFVIPYAKTVTYQPSYFTRSCKSWNVLSSDLRNRDIGLFSFKSGLKSYYNHALSSTFDVDDPRTWKSVCIKCKRARSLNEAIMQLLLAVLLH
jgi:hypothetical protein